MLNNDRKKYRFKIAVISLSFLTIVLFFISMCVGRYSISITEVVGFFTFKNISDLSLKVIKYLRIPRTLIAALIGCALAISGTLYQSLFNNKLVSPDLLGVSSGASVGACAAILIGLSSIMISISAFTIGLTTVLLTLLMTRIVKNRSNVVLLLSGIAMGGLMSSLVGLMKYLADNEMKLAEMTFWLLGDISNSTIEDVYILIPIVLIGVFISLILSWRLNIVSLGEKEAKSLGVNYKKTKIMLILTATLLTAGSVAISGTVGWVGLVIPNIVRLITGSDNRKVLPMSMLTGSCLMILIDMLARSLAPNEIPLSVIAGIIGTPIFIFFLCRKSKELI